MNAFRPARLTLAILLLGSACAAASPDGRVRLRLDFGWRFHLGDDWGPGYSLAKAGEGSGPAGPAFSDAGWRQVRLPHDWAVELPFDPGADSSHGFKPIGPGFPQNSVGWYRLAFTLPSSASGRRIWLEFGGVYRDAAVFVNGWFVGRHESGYDSFRYDITDVAHCGGSNVVAVRVDASRFEGWFYEGAGIYRNVWLVETAPVAVAPGGVFVSTSFPGPVPAGPAEVRLRARLMNAGSAPADAEAVWEIRSPEGRPLAVVRKAVRIPAAGTAAVETLARVAAPELWSPETPRLYRLTTSVAVGGRTVDAVDTPFGIRTVAFDPRRGFLLNGRPYVLKGTCDHQDHAGVGVAVPDALWDFRIARLKAMGSNALRTAHGAPAPALLDACDRLGMLVMDENRLLGSDAGNLAELAGQVRRDRNHPSVAIWSLANEEFAVQDTPAGRRVAATMQALVRRLDPTRPITYAAPVGDDYAGINSVIEVRGWNYHPGPDMDAYHREHPDQPNVGTEQGSTIGTRGIYANDPRRGFVSAYGDEAPKWAQTAETWWSYFAPRPWLSGGFVWTGFDYRGEPTPYGWPCISSQFGILDTCGFPKDNFWYYKSWWTDRPVLHLLPHWNWPGREGRPIDVRAESNCDQVELFLNGRSLGRKAVPRYGEVRWEVPYAPGTLSARGYRDGRLAAEAEVETTGAPAAVRLTPDRDAIAADGEDVAVVAVSVVDRKGRVVPVASNRVDFTLEGPGRIIGVGNGDPSCHEPDVVVSLPAFRSVDLDDWRWRRVAAYGLPLAAAALRGDDSSWRRVAVRGERAQLGSDENGVLRAEFTLPAGELSAPVIELWFGRIEGDGPVTVNGRIIGQAGDPQAPSVYDVKGILHPGRNTVAVALTNYGAEAGLSRGVSLRFEEPPRPVSWSRSVFNGLAEIMVQSDRKPGVLRLTARAAGLQPAILVLRSQPVAGPSAAP